MKTFFNTKIIVFVFVILSASCSGVSRLGKLPLTNHKTYADIAIKPYHTTICAGLPEKYDPEDADRVIMVQGFIVNCGKESVSIRSSRWINHEIRLSDNIEKLLPGKRVKFYEGPLSHFGTSIVQPPSRAVSREFRIEIKPISRIDKDCSLIIFSNWGRGIDL